jgi:hypothetical protein
MRRSGRWCCEWKEGEPVGRGGGGLCACRLTRPAASTADTCVRQVLPVGHQAGRRAREALWETLRRLPLRRGQRGSQGGPAANRERASACCAFVRALRRPAGETDQKLRATARQGLPLSPGGRIARHPWPPLRRGLSFVQPLRPPRPERRSCAPHAAVPLQNQAYDLARLMHLHNGA